MARIASGTLDVALRVVEGNTGAGLGSTSRHSHDVVLHLDFANGTADGEINRAHSSTVTFTTTPSDIDLAGSLTSEIAGGAVTTFAEVSLILIQNLGSVALHIGGDAASIPLFGNVADFIVLPAGGILLLTAPAGIAVTATTGDILQIVAASGTCAGKVTLLGRSA